MSSDPDDPREGKGLVHWLRLTRVPGLGPILLGRLLAHFRAPEAILRASPHQLEQVPGVGPRTTQRLRQLPAAEPIRAELARLAGMGGRVILYGTPLYPAPLAAIPDPPPVLFCLGDPAHLLGEGLVAVVGSRSASRAGLQTARTLAAALARRGMVTVSGMARGVDSAAHRGAIEAGGDTVGVLATGLDVEYPPGHTELRRQVVERGCLITEAPLGTPPHPYLFPPRNRIISGLSRGVVVVEASLRSGSLITARMALEQGREVFAVPGPANDRRVQGNHQLLRQGARLVEGIEDIVEELAWPVLPAWQRLEHPATPPPDAPGGPSPPPQPTSHHPSPLPRGLPPLLALLQEGPTQVNQMVRLGQLTVGELSFILLQLELAGVVERLPGDLYILRTPLPRGQRSPE